MCRIGSLETNFHCDRCGICFSATLKDTHKCTDNTVNNPCPICQENLKHSVKGITMMDKCGHWIHVSCYNDYLKHS